MPDLSLANVDADNIEFFRRAGGRKTSVSLPSLYNPYHGLDALIDFNYGERLVEEKRQVVDQQELMDNWEQELPGDVFASVPLFDGGKLELKVVYRTNMSRDLKKIPNIIHLQPEDGVPLYVIRRAVSYEDRVLQNVENTFAPDVSDCLHRGQEADGSCPVHLPEYLATQALEEYYREGYTRVTPPYKEVTSAHDLYYLREWMNHPIKDLGSIPGMLAKHIGFLNSLGVISRHDRDVDHYFSVNFDDDTTVVNIDPDFMIWVPRISGNEEYREQFAEIDEHSSDGFDDFGDVDDDYEDHFFSHEDECDTRIDLGSDAEDYRHEFIKDEDEFRDMHHSTRERLSDDDLSSKKYVSVRDRQLTVGEIAAREFLFRVNEQL